MKKSRNPYSSMNYDKGPFKVSDRKIMKAIFAGVVEFLEKQYVPLSQEVFNDAVREICKNLYIQIGGLKQNPLQDFDFFCAVEEAQDDLTEIIPFEEKTQREKDLQERAGLAGIENTKFVKMIERGEFLSDTAFIVLEDFLKLVSKEFLKKTELRIDMLNLAITENYTSDPFYFTLFNGEYFTSEEATLFERKIKNEKSLKAREEKRKRREYKRTINKIVQSIKKFGAGKHRITQKIARNEVISEKEIEELQAVIQQRTAEINEMINKKKKEREEKEFQSRITETLKKGLAHGLDKNPVVLKIQKGEKIHISDLNALEGDIMSAAASKEKENSAKESLPELLQQAEKIFEGLSAREQREYVAKLNQYRKDVEKMKRPIKLRKSLKWIIDKMSGS